MTPTLRWHALAPAVAIGLFIFAAAVAAHAHCKGKAEHGGMLQLVGETSVELVNRPDHVEVWVEDATSTAERIGLAARYGIAGVASWRLGLEDPAVWDAVRDWRSTKEP